MLCNCVGHIAKKLSKIVFLVYFYLLSFEFLIHVSIYFIHLRHVVVILLLAICQMGL